jgi:hypothetical protein
VIFTVIYICNSFFTGKSPDNDYQPEVGLEGKDVAGEPAHLAFVEKMLALLK